jgi:regulation of enolase protein 1 (concanavalin A-like superfamily)
MATSTICPSCGHTFSPGDSLNGGLVTCPNPSCAQAFEVQPAARVRPAAPGTMGPPIVKPRPRGPYARPELLDELPTSFLVSPPMFVMGFVFVLMYGLVLFSVVSSARKRAAELALLEPEPPPPPVFAPLGPTPEPEPVKPAPAPVKGGSQAARPKAPAKPAEKPATPRAEPAKPAAPKPSPPAVATVKGLSASPKPAEKPATAKPEPEPAPPAPAVDLAPIPWGVLNGVPGDCKFLPEADLLRIEVPAALHVLSPEFQVWNAPMLLTEVQGDFDTSVRVTGQIRPGTKPLDLSPALLKKAAAGKKRDAKPADKAELEKLPITFQGAGLLIWLDPSNYLRFERTSIFNTLEARKYHRVFLELCVDGKPTWEHRDATEGNLTLKLERRGAEIRPRYTRDGKTWLDLRRQTVPFPADVQVGVSASNAADKPFRVQLEEFTLSRPEDGPRKGQ